MKRTSVSEAKSHFSSYLNDVQRGETVLIFDRGRLVARLEPVSNAEVPEAEWIKALVRLGIASAPRRSLDTNGFLRRHRPRLPEGASGPGTLVKDRDAR